MIYGRSVRAFICVPRWLCFILRFSCQLMNMARQLKNFCIKQTELDQTGRIRTKGKFVSNTNFSEKFNPLDYFVRETIVRETIVRRLVLFSKLPLLPERLTTLKLIKFSYGFFLYKKGI